jgi:uncharacterized protein (TIGR03086 family)
MTTMHDFEPPARELKKLLNGVSDDQLTAPTPCEKFTVGDLLDHVVGLTIAFRHAAMKSTGPGADGGRPGEVSAANLDQDWRDKLPSQLDELVAAWRDPAAWEGITEAGGVTLPAEVMASVAIDELVLHSWDLACATGQPYDCDPDSAQVCFGFTSAMSAPEQEAGRQGLFGPVVAVPEDAPLFHRALGFSGRDPSWVPPADRPA